MNQDMQLPDEVVAAIRANRKIEAIKLLREHAGIGLKDAKQTVDQYMALNPHVVADARPSGSGSGHLGDIMKIVIALVLGYVAYRLAA